MTQLLSGLIGNCHRRLPISPGLHLSPPRTEMLRQIAFGASIATFVLLALVIGLSVGPRFFGYSSFVVYGGSMEPTVPKGSVAVGQAVEAAELKVDDVVVYRASGSRMPTLHRILTIEQQGDTRLFTTKGDANAEQDPQQLQLAGEGTRVLYSVPYAGYLVHASGTAWGPIVLIWLPALSLLAMVLWTIWRPARPKAEDAPETGRIASGG